MKEIKAYSKSFSKIRLTYITLVSQLKFLDIKNDTFFPNVSKFCILIYIISIVVNRHKVGNGYSILENMHDHGLNDWSFQMKNNQKNMFRTALSFSDNYRYPIEWKITDGWFTFPEIYIRRGQHNRAKHNGFRHLSPGLSFNYGNKIQYTKY